MKKVLLLTYAFSPQSTPESILSAKLFANTKEIITDVVTIEQPIPGTIDLDPSLEKYINKNFNKIFRCKLNFFFKIISFLNLKRLFPFPDYFVLLNNYIYNFILKNINIGDYDYIITWSQSHSMHLVGLRLKNKFKLNNWVTYFSDPWSDNPFFNKSFFGFEKYYNLISEKKVFNNCNKIICTSIETKELMGMKYSNQINNKIYVIPHCFDRKLYTNIDRPSALKGILGNKIKFRYIGKFYGKRFPNILIEALKIIEKRNYNLFNKINFEVYGSQNFLVMIKLHFYKKYITSFGPLSYSKSLSLMQTSDYLLVIDAPFKKSVFFPSKLVDYMGSNITVLGITPKGTARRIIKDMGGHTLSHNDPELLAEQLIQLLEGKILPNKVNLDFINEYNSENVAKKFFNVLEL